MECINLIENYLKGKTERDFRSCPQLQDAVIRRIELIGEAVKNIPQDIKDLHPDILWKRIAGMRDILIHNYLGVDIDIAWRVTQKEIPVLKEQMLKLKQELEE